MSDRITQAVDFGEVDSSRFWSRVDIPDESGCTLWTSTTDGKYGTINVRGRSYKAHRLSWMIAYGSMPNEGLVLDHFVCGNGLCVNVEHLRAVTHPENCRRQVLKKNNKSGFKGVHWSGAAKKWQAMIMKDRRWKYLGIFESVTDAAEAYDSAAVEIFGESALTNRQLGLLP